MINKTWLFMTALCLFLFTSAAAQTDEEGVRTALHHYLSGEHARMEKAFHPSATMKFVDNKSGEFRDVPIAEFLERVKANTTKTERKTEIIAINIEGSAAQGKLRIETDKVIFYDYMNLLKVGGEWKIVSKIFSRIDK